MSDNRPVGVFDSGVGGLSILCELERALPNERFVYYADTLRCPWGSRPPEEIISLASEATDALLRLDCKLIVVACNSATTIAIGTLRECFEVPFVGTVPAVRPAAQLTRGNAVAVIATQATIHSASLGALIDEFAPNADVFRYPCPDELVQLIEAGVVDGPMIESLLSLPLQEVRKRAADVLVLGCTHYAFLRETIQRLVGHSVIVLDTGVPVARQVGRLLEKHDLCAAGAPSTSSVKYVATSDSERFERVAGSLRQAYESIGSPQTSG